MAHVVVNKRLHHLWVVYKVTDKYVLVMDPGSGRMEKRPWEQWRRNGPAYCY